MAGRKCKPVKSTAPFNAMGNIPDEDLRKMLSDVVNGRNSLTGFTQACIIYKAKARVQSTILRHVELTNWSQAQAQYKMTCSIEFVDMWAQVIVSKKLKLKESLPKEFHQALLANYNMDRKMNDNERALLQVH